MIFIFDFNQFSFIMFILGILKNFFDSSTSRFLNIMLLILSVSSVSKHVTRREFEKEGLLNDKYLSCEGDIGCLLQWTKTVACVDQSNTFEINVL